MLEWIGYWNELTFVLALAFGHCMVSTQRAGFLGLWESPRYEVHNSTFTSPNNDLFKLFINVKHLVAAIHIRLSGINERVGRWIDGSVLTSRYPPRPLTRRTGDAVSACEFNIRKLWYIMFIVLSLRLCVISQVLLVLFLLWQRKQRLSHGWACLHRNKSWGKFSALQCKS